MLKIKGNIECFAYK